MTSINWRASGASSLGFARSIEVAIFSCNALSTLARSVLVRFDATVHRPSEFI